MNKKSIFTWLITLILFSVIFSYSLVFAWTWIFNNTTKVVFKLSDNIYLDSLKLSNTKILFKSNEDISDFKIKSECSIFSKMTDNKWDFYMFQLKFFDNECKNENFILVNNKNEIKANFKLNLISEYFILSKMLDLDNSRLSKIKKSVDKKVLEYSDFIKYDKKIESSYYTFLEKNRLLNEFIYNRNIIDNIIKKRSEKYVVPVLGQDLPTIAVKIPNSWRWYRSDYTDWIHHAWDIDWEFWEQVVALDEWIIIRVVSDFDYSNLNAIKKWDNLTEYDKVRNLDILRWKQVWLKTMSGDLIMYSHLNDIFSNIRVWEVVRKKQPLWTTWITGVPDKNYKDYHLHFAVHTNPFLWKKGWYDIDDYMMWDWLFKWKTKEYILENQWKYFESSK